MSIRALTVLTRKAGMSVEEFREYWRTKHAPIGASFPRLTSYTQHHVVDTLRRGSMPAPEPTIDGFSDLTFASRADLDVALSSEVASAAAEDAAKFMSQMRMYVVEEHVVLPATNRPLVGAGGTAGVATFAPGESFPAHSHTRVTEVLVCTRSTITLNIGGTVRSLRSGESAVVLPGIVHSILNTSGATAEVFYVKVPGDLDDLVWVDGGVAEAGEGVRA